MKKFFDKTDYLNTLLLQIKETEINKSINDLNSSNIKNLNLAQSNKNIIYRDTPNTKLNLDEEYLKILIEKENQKIKNNNNLPVYINDNLMKDLKNNDNFKYYDEINKFKINLKKLYEDNVKINEISNKFNYDEIKKLNEIFDIISSEFLNKYSYNNPNLTIDDIYDFLINYILKKIGVHSLRNKEEEDTKEKERIFREEEEKNIRETEFNKRKEEIEKEERIKKEEKEKEERIKKEEIEQKKLFENNILRLNEINKEISTLENYIKENISNKKKLQEIIDKEVITQTRLYDNLQQLEDNYNIIILKKFKSNKDKTFIKSYDKHVKDVNNQIDNTDKYIDEKKKFIDEIDNKNNSYINKIKDLEKELYSIKEKLKKMEPKEEKKNEIEEDIIKIQKKDNEINKLNEIIKSFENNINNLEKKNNDLEIEISKLEKYNLDNEKKYYELKTKPGKKSKENLKLINNYDENVQNINYLKKERKKNQNDIENIFSGIEKTKKEIEKLNENDEKMIPKEGFGLKRKNNNYGGKASIVKSDNIHNINNKLLINKDKLYNNNILSFRNEKGNRFEYGKNHRISDDLVYYLDKLINNESFHLNEAKKILEYNEFLLLYNILKFSGLLRKYNDNKLIDNKIIIDEVKNKYENIIGEIEAGNNNKKILDQLYNILSVMYHLRIISRPNFVKHYKEIKNYYFDK
jgi:hypothetical protein